MKNKFTLIVIADPDEIKQLAILKKLLKKDIVKITKKYYMCLTGIGKLAHEKLLKVINKYKNNIDKIINLGLAAGSKKYKMFDIVKINDYYLGEPAINNKLNSCYTVDSFLDIPMDQNLNWIVDMEAYYFNKLCNINNIKFESYKIIVDRGSYQEYLKNLVIAKSYIMLMINKIINQNCLIGGNYIE